MSEQEQIHSPASGPGARLKAQREALGLSLEHVAAQLKLSSRQIASIEADHFDQLPGNTFARGFVRNYARLLHLDPAPVLADLESLLPRERVQVALPHLVEESNSFSLGGGGGVGSGKVLGWLGFVLAFVAAVAAIFWYLQQPPSPELAATQTASEPQIEMASAPADVVATASEVAVASAATMAESASQVAVAVAASKPVPVAVASVVATAAVASAVENGDLRIVADADTWVQVVDAKGTKLVSNLLTAGTDRSFGGVPPYHVRIGNAPKTKIWLRGQAVDLTQYTKTDVASLELK
ncbi:RodZ domain-containing protein [Silvimonas sp.]|uniref:RodZ domain-containing protein n=1 Tax=Silvimonas sp. TaxID=2650811 RepID=UPI00283AC7E1|nr:RodZ domain-containing protein [Silvimonas sp.]MDR3428562.1 DUF4115 domain-containing protein [Silvimonas sp.]